MHDLVEALGQADDQIQVALQAVAVLYGHVVDPVADAKRCSLSGQALDLVARSERLPASGETVWGHDYFEAAGGKGLNQAVAAARAGFTKGKGK